MAREPRPPSDGSICQTKVGKATKSSTKSPKKPNSPEAAVRSERTATNEVTVLDFIVSNAKSSITCNIRPSDPPPNTSLMIFTHGASGTNEILAMFAEGFARATSLKTNAASDSPDWVSSIICFQGPMNLKSRTTMFHQVINHCSKSSSPPFGAAQYKVPVLGGRSMGARAAVIAASTDQNIKMLVLVSYPLESNGQMRDQILLDIKENVEVLFVIGEKDSMCDLAKLATVRQKMKAFSWLVTVEGTNHGMAFKQKQRTPEVQITTGRIVADWVNKGEVRTTTGDVGGMEGCKMEMTLPVIQTKSNTPKQLSKQGKPKAARKRVSDSTAVVGAANPTRQSKRLKAQ